MPNTASTAVTSDASPAASTSAWRRAYDSRAGRVITYTVVIVACLALVGVALLVALRPVTAPADTDPVIPVTPSASYSIVPMAGSTNGQFLAVATTLQSDDSIAQHCPELIGGKGFHEYRYCTGVDLAKGSHLNITVDDATGAVTYTLSVPQGQDPVHTPTAAVASNATGKLSLAPVTVTYGEREIHVTVVVARGQSIRWIYSRFVDRDDSDEDSAN